MKLSALKENQKATVVKIDCERELRKRLETLGIIKGAKIHVIKKLWAKGGIMLKIMGYRIAVRREIGDKIEVMEND